MKIFVTFSGENGLSVRDFVRDLRVRFMGTELSSITRPLASQTRIRNVLVDGQFWNSVGSIARYLFLEQEKIKVL